MTPEETYCPEMENEMQVPRRVGIIANLDKAEAEEVARLTVRQLRDLRLEPVLEEALAERLGLPGVPQAGVLAGSDLVLVLGGDGTLLSVAREHSKSPVPLLGVKLGNFGFLASAAVSELPEVLQLISVGNFATSNRSALACEVRDAEDGVLHETSAVNDVYLSRFSARRLVTLEMVVNRHSAIEYRTDGLIISTPSGSTGHSLAAGGPIVVPDVEGMIITPVCAHTLAARPLVTRSDDVLEFRVRGEDEENIVATVDGQMNFDVPHGGSVRIRGDKYRFVLIKSPRRTYYDVLRNKFHLGAP